MKKTISSYTSDKIKIISLLLMISVINWHSSYSYNEIDCLVFNIKLQYLFTGIFAMRVTIQLFFIISGFLFFWNLENISSVFSKMKKRVNSILIPYIIACTFFVFVSLSISLIPPLAKYMNWAPNYLLHESWNTILIHTFFDHGGNGPLAFHLWFLRNLIIIIACSPILFYIHKYLKSYFIIVILVIDYFYNYNSIVTSLLWFYIGACLVDFNMKINLKKLALICLPIFILIIILELFFNIKVPRKYEYILILFNIITVWSAYDLFIPKSFSLKNNSLLTEMCSITFFLYLFHLPFISVIKKFIVIILGKNSLGYAIGYLTTPFIFLFLSLFITVFLKKYFSKSYAVCVGGR